MQRDTFFNVKKGRYYEMLVTDWKENSQFMLLAPQKVNLLKKMINKIFFPKSKMNLSRNSKGELMEIFEPLNMDELMKRGKSGQFTVGYHQGVTGFGNKETNEAFRKIKNEYIGKMFR